MKVRVWLAVALSLCAAGPALAQSPKAQPYDWQTIPFAGGGFVDGFLYHPTQKNLLYARTDVGGAYRFDYDRSRWIPLMDGFGKADWDCMGVLSLAVDVQNPNRLYATCGLYLNARASDAGVLRSDDQGATWRKTPLPFKLGGNALGRGDGERLQVDPNQPERIFLGTNQDGLWLSTDGARSFSRVTGYPDSGVTFVVIDGIEGAKGKASQVIYAGSGTAGGGVYISRDGGLTFTPIPGSPKFTPHQAALDAGGTLYVSFADGLGPHEVKDGAVFKLDKTGIWTDISPAHPTRELTFGYSGLDLDRQRPGTVVVSTSDRYPGLDDIYLSRDGGAHWKPVKPQADHHFDGYPWLVNYMTGADKDSANRNNMGHWMDALKINPFNPDELVYGTGYGVWMTRDFGHMDLMGKDGSGPVDFQFADDNLEETVVLGLESPPTGPSVLMAAGDVAGTAFDDFSHTPDRGLFAPTNKTNQSVAFAALKPEIVVRSVDAEDTRGFISMDGAQSWTPLPSAPPPLTGDWHAHRAGKIVISSLATALVWVPEGEAAYMSKDMGRSWTPSQGWPTPERGQEAIADKVADGVFYVYDRHAGAVLISEDGGASFRSYVDHLPVIPVGQAQLRAVPGQARDLWLAAPDGLYHTRNGEPAVRAPGVDAAWQVTFGKAAPGSAYPAAYLWGEVRGQEGLWRSDDAGTTWVRINDDAHRFGQLRAMAGDPNRYGVLYIAPDGRGTMVGQPSK